MDEDEEESIQYLLFDCPALQTSISRHVPFSNLEATFSNNTMIIVLKEIRKESSSEIETSDHLNV